MVFLIMPVVAPTFGQLTLLIAPWRWIFFGLGGFGAIMLGWTLIRLPETLHPSNRRPLAWLSIREAAMETLTNRQSIGYTLAFTLMIGALTGYIVSIQQIFSTYSKRPS